MKIKGLLIAGLLLLAGMAWAGEAITTTEPAAEEASYYKLIGVSHISMEVLAQMLGGQVVNLYDSGSGSGYGRGRSGDYFSPYPWGGEYTGYPSEYPYTGNPGYPGIPGYTGDPRAPGYPGYTGYPDPRYPVNPGTRDGYYQPSRPTYPGNQPTSPPQRYRQPYAR